MDWPTIKYKYHYNRSIGEQYSTEGYGEAQFFEGDHKTEKFSGLFSELRGNRVTYYEGWRVPKKDLSDLADSEDPKKRRTRVEEFFEKLLSNAADVQQVQALVSGNSAVKSGSVDDSRSGPPRTASTLPG
jgi:hypothetical protein